jgi:hypothetical protein
MQCFFLTPEDWKLGNSIEVVSESQRGLSSEESGLAEMMISGCPWRRASDEYAPGPRHKSAIAMAAVNTAETLADA